MGSFRVCVGFVWASALCLLAGSTGWAEQGTGGGELEALKRKIDQVISENQELKRRVRDLEAAMTKQREAEEGEAEEVVGKPAEEEEGEEVARKAAEEGEAEEVVGKPAEEEEGEEVARKAAEERKARRDVSRAPDEEAEETAEDDTDLASKINKYVNFGGAIEVETGWSEDFDNVSESHIDLDTAEFDFEVIVSEWTRGTFIVEWDDDGDKLTIDEAFVKVGNTRKFPLFVSAGRAIAPFGISTGDPVADTMTISDPLTIEAFETKEDLALLGFERGDFTVGAYAFNGETNKRGGSQDHIEHVGATAKYRVEHEDFFADFGVDFLSSVFDADGLTEFFPDALESNYAPGMAAHVRSRMGHFSFVAEYNGALDTVEFTAEEENLSIAPEAWQVQLGYMTIPTDDADEGTYFAVGYSESMDLAGALPERRVLATVGKWLYPGLRLAMEYRHDNDYDEADGGTGNSANAFTTQLTYEW